MSLQTIAQTLHNEALQGNLITIDDALLGSGTAFSTLVAGSLLRTQGNVLLTANASAIPQNPAGNSFTFSAGIPAVAADSFLNLSGNAVTVSISQAGNVYQVQLTIALRQSVGGDALGWVFSDSFPATFGWPFDALPLNGPQFIFLYGQNDLLPEGLNFESSFSLTGVLAPIGWFLGLSPALDPLAGLITQTPYGPEFVLNGPVAGVPEVNLTALIINSPTIQASMGYLAFSPAQGTYSEPWGQISLSATTTLPGVQNPLIVTIAIPYIGTADYLTLTIAPLPGSVSTSINELDQWMATKSWDDFFTGTPASVLLPYLNTFGLQSYTLSFTLGTFSVMSTSISVGTLTPWVIIPDKLVMPTFSVGWQLIDPFGAAYSSIAIQGQLDMFGSGSDQVTFTGAILLPELRLSLALFSQTEMTAAQWLQTIISGFGGDTLPQYITDALSAFDLKQMLFAMDVPNQLLSYTLAGSFTVGDNPVDFNLYLDLALEPTLRYDIGVEFVFACVEVKGEITNRSGDTIIACSWADATNPLDLKDIAESLGFGELGIPPEMDMGLKGLALSYNLTQGVFAIGADSANYGKADLLVFKPTGSDTYALFGGLAVDKPIDLTNLPLVGRALSVLNTAEVNDLQVLITSAVITEAQVTQLNTIIEALDQKLLATFPKVPAQGMAATVNISFVLNIGGYMLPMGSGIGGQSTTNMPAARSAVQGTPSGNTQVPVTTSPGNQSNGTTWLNVQKTIGTVTFRRIGIRYSESVLWFLLDASFKEGGLNIDLIGMGIGSPVADFEPQFTLSGLGIDLQYPGLEIGGSLMKIPPTGDTAWAYAGGAIIKGARFSIGALGSYQSVYTDSTHTTTMPSMFVFGQVTGSFGGPPAFFVTGLAGGFGYNSSLRLPGINEVYQFPLVAGAQDPSVIGGPNATPAQVLASLMGLNGGTPWITPAIGQYWFAAGLQFTSFSLVSTNALLIAQFGNHLQFALLGLSRARFPMAGPVTYAFIELQLQVIIDPTVGEFGVSAVLSPNSYLLDPSCRLMGGFAFHAWFSPSVHAGDFVITIGGYHPSFDPPAWYPQVPNVGFSWSLDSTVSITGASYFAMTPAAIMAGGRLHVTYRQGDLRAWFTAWANMLLYWNPFHFDTELGISVGASYRLELTFTTVTMQAELGANMRLYGPPTGGSVTVHWWVISFTINFGATPSRNSPPLTWTQFQEQLPASGDRIKILPLDGLSANGSANLNSGTPWIVRPSRFGFSVTSAVPNSSLTLGSTGATFHSGDSINIRPMQDNTRNGNADQGKNLVSVHNLSLHSNNGEVDLQSSLAGWDIQVITENIPTAMWGTGPQSQVPSGNDQLIAGQPVGFTLKAPDTILGFTPGVINAADNLLFVTVSNNDTLPIQPNLPYQGAVAEVNPNTISVIQQQIAEASYTAARTALFNNLVALGVNPITDGDMGSYATAAGGIFADTPLLVPAS